jgi:F1F0 ATPase subunit 2
MTIDPISTLISFVFGLAIGAVYFRVLWHSAGAIAKSKSPWRAAVKGGGLRMVVLFGSFAILVFFGAAAVELIVWLIGFVLARVVAVRCVRRIQSSSGETRP